MRVDSVALLLLDRILDHLLLLVRRNRCGVDGLVILLLRPSAAKQRLENVPRLPRRVGAFRVIAGDEVGAAAASTRTRLELRDSPLQLGHLSLDLPALGGRIGTEEQELLIIAAHRMGVSGSLRELGPLLFESRLGATAAASRRGCDCRLQPGAFGALGESRTVLASPSAENCRSREKSANKRRRLTLAELHAVSRRPSPSGRPRKAAPISRILFRGLDSEIAARTWRRPQSLLAIWPAS